MSLQYICWVYYCNLLSIDVTATAENNVPNDKKPAVTICRRSVDTIFDLQPTDLLTGRIRVWRMLIAECIRVTKCRCRYDHIRRPVENGNLFGNAFHVLSTFLSTSTIIFYIIQLSHMNFENRLDACRQLYVHNTCVYVPFGKLFQYFDIGNTLQFYIYNIMSCGFFVLYWLSNLGRKKINRLLLTNSSDHILKIWSIRSICRPQKVLLSQDITYMKTAPCVCSSHRVTYKL